MAPTTYKASTFCNAKSPYPDNYARPNNVNRLPQMVMADHAVPQPTYCPA